MDHSVSKYPTKWQTDVGLIEMVQAEQADLIVVTEILNAAAARLNAKGIAQWQIPMPESARTLLATEIANGHLFLAYLQDDKRPIGTLRIDLGNSKLWPDRNTAAGYIYTLAIHPHFMGRKLGEALLAWAKNYLRAHGRTILRLDCWAENTKLQHYYERLGFIYRGTVDDEGYPLRLYEIAI